MLTVTPLKPFGAIVLGLRVDTLTPARTEQVRRLLADNGMLLLPDQHAGDHQFVNFLRSFGTLTFTIGETPVSDFPDLNLISNIGRPRPPRSSFHTDTSYVQRPPAYTALRAVVAPRRGGDTLFTNQYAAYDALPQHLRAMITGRRATHIATGVKLGDGYQTSAEHPLAMTHPISGRTALYLSTAERCRAVSGLNDSDATKLIGRLLSYSTRKGNIFRHHWAPGDVVIWDNRCVMHRADHRAGDSERVLHRGTVHDGH
jgi:taurine dioxygenase